MSNKYAFLGHKYNPFNKPNISNTAKQYGFEYKDSVESHLWVYELYYQIQKRSGTSCVLKGGACAQLYLPLDVQRCTLDLDLATSLTSEELFELLNSITNDFNTNRFYSAFKEYIPRMPLAGKQLIPMKTFLFTLPFIYKKGRRGVFADIKMDFVFLPPDRFPTTYVDKGKTFGLDLKFSPYSLTQYSIICNKILTFAVNSIGLDTYKIEYFYKNIYDLYFLINEYNNLDCFRHISEIIDENIRLEASLKDIEPLDKQTLLTDILETLNGIFTFDLQTAEPRLHRRVLEFENKCLQSSIRQDLNPDSWAIMAMYIFIWVLALKEYISSGTASQINLINEVLDAYDYYLTLQKKEKRRLLQDYRKRIFEKDSRLMLNRGITPLRIIYLRYIYENLY